MTDDPLLIFVHISKTGGNTVRAVLRNIYGREHFADLFLPPRVGRGDEATRRKISRSQIELLENPRIRACAINAPAVLHHFLRRPVTYISTIRQPASRLRSYWNFAYVTRNTKPRWALYERHDFDVVALVEKEMDPGLVNDQVRILSGASRFQLLGSDVDQAHANILHRFALLATSESLDRVVPRFFADEWREKWEVPRENQGKPCPAELSDDDLSYLLDVNSLDCELYDWFQAEAADGFIDAAHSRLRVS